MLKIIKGKYNPISRSYSQRLAQICTLCLATDTSKRPTVLGMLSHPALMQKASELGIPLPPEVATAHAVRLAGQQGPKFTLAPRPDRTQSGPRVQPPSPALGAKPPVPKARPGSPGDPSSAAPNMGLPLFNRGAIELRKPGGHIQSRRVRAKKQGPPAGKPESPPVVPPPPPPKRAKRGAMPCRRPSGVRLLRRDSDAEPPRQSAPPTPGSTRSVKSTYSDKDREADIAAVADLPDDPLGASAAHGPPSGSHGAHAAHALPQTKWGRAAEFAPIELHGTYDPALTGAKGRPPPERHGREPVGLFVPPGVPLNNAAPVRGVGGGRGSRRRGIAGLRVRPCAALVPILGGPVAGPSGAGTAPMGPTRACLCVRVCAWT